MGFKKNVLNKICFFFQKFVGFRLEKLLIISPADSSDYPEQGPTRLLQLLNSVAYINVLSQPSMRIERCRLIVHFTNFFIFNEDFVRG